MHLTTLPALALLLAVLPGAASALAINNVAVEAGGGAKVQMVRVGVQSDWRTFFHSNGTHLAAYWDFSLGQWRGNAHRNIDGQHQGLTDIGATPVFRFQSDTRKGWYIEGGIGYHLLSRLYDNDSNKLATAFQFGDHVGVGYVFDNAWELGLKAQHFSNGGIKRPNSGVNFLVLKLAKPF